jgi:hypothetical protein
MRNRLLVFTIAILVALGLAQPASASGTGQIQNAPTSKSVVASSNSCYAGKLTGGTYYIKIGSKSGTNYNSGFRVAKNRKFTAFKNGQRWIYNVVSQGNAVCHSNNDNIIVFDLGWE